LRAHVDPLGGEAELRELGNDHVTNSRDTGLVHGAAILVDPTLEQAERPLLFGIDGRRHALFGRAERGICWRPQNGCGGGECQQDS
jgi:hypothetical protein